MAFCALDRPGDDHSLERPPEQGKHLDEWHGTSRAQKCLACGALTFHFSSALAACTVPDIEYCYWYPFAPCQE